MIRNYPTRAAVALCALVNAHILIGAEESLAQPFEVKGLGEGVGGPDEGVEEAGEGENASQRGFEAGEIEFAANSAYQTGFPDEAEDASSFASELSVGLALTNWLKANGSFLAREVDDEWEASSAALEATLSPTIFHQTSYGAGLFLALEAGIDDDATNEFIFGPIFELSSDGMPKITINTFFEDTFGDNSEEGLAFAYGSQVKWELPKGLAVGLESFGEVEDVFGDPPDLDDQEHRIGPVVFLNFEEAFGTAAPNFEVNFGVLAGITRETPDLAFKLNFEMPLGGLK